MKEYQKSLTNSEQKQEIQQIKTQGIDQLFEEDWLENKHELKKAFCFLQELDAYQFLNKTSVLIPRLFHQHDIIMSKTFESGGGMVGVLNTSVINTIILLSVFEHGLILTGKKLEELDRKDSPNSLFCYYPSNFLRGTFIAEIGGDFIAKVMQSSGAFCKAVSLQREDWEGTTSTSQQLGINLRTYKKAFNENSYDFVVSNQVFEEGSGITKVTLGEDNHDCIAASFVLLATEAKMAKRGRFILNSGSIYMLSPKDFLSKIGLKRVTSIADKYNCVDILIKLQEHQFTQKQIINFVS